jgi:hypothetical protein
VTPPVLTSGLRLLAPPSETPVEVQVSEDGDVWTTIQVIDPSEHWRVITLDAGEMNGRAIYVRVVVIS